MTKPMSPEDDLRAALLERCGLPRAQARVFTLLLRGPGVTASDMASAAGLSRQQAGDAANALELDGLARVERVASGGRPSNVYHLATDAATSVARLIAARRAALADESAALDALDALIR